MRVTRYVALGAALFLELTAGTAYGYGAYSEHLKHVLGGQQSAINLVASIGQIGLYTAILAGFFYDRFGAQATVLLGGSIAALGYALAYLATLGTGLLPPTTVSMSAFFFLAWHGSAYLDTAVVTDALKNYPRDKGSVLGLLKSFFGLSGSVVAQVSVGVFPSGGGAVSPGGGAHGGVPLLLLMCAWVVVVCLAAFRLLRLDPIRTTALAKVDGFGWRRLGFGYSAVLGLAVYLTVIGIVRTHSSLVDGARARVATTGGMVGLTLLVGLLVALPRCKRTRRLTTAPYERTEALLDRGAEQGAAGSTGVGAGTSGGSTSTLSTGARGAQGESATPAATSSAATPTEPDFAATAAAAAAAAAAARSMHDECTMRGALATWDLHLLFGALFCGTGPGLMVLSNVAQIAQARAGAFTSSAQTACHTSDFYHTLGSTFVVVCGVSNCLGRLLAGVLSDRCGALSRPGWLAAFLLLMASSQAVLALVDGVGALYGACALCFLA